MSAVTKLTEDKSYRGGNCWENVTQPVSSATPPEALAASSQLWGRKKNPKVPQSLTKFSLTSTLGLPLLFLFQVLIQAIINVTVPTCVAFRRGSIFYLIQATIMITLTAGLWWITKDRRRWFISALGNGKISCDTCTFSPWKSFGWLETTKQDISLY